LYGPSHRRSRFSYPLSGLISKRNTAKGWDWRRAPGIIGGMRNAELSRILEEIADILEILGEDRFRINSYRKVARVIAETPIDVTVLAATGQLQNLTGVGKSSMARIEEFIETGSIGFHRELLEKIPVGLLELLDIPGMGPKGVKAVYAGLQVESLDDLKKAIESGAVAELPGFGDKKASSLSRGIEFLEKTAGRIRLDQAMNAAGQVTGFLDKVRDVKKIMEAGSLRRCAETIGDVDILVGVSKRNKNPAAIVKAFVEAPFVHEVIAAGDTKGSAIVDSYGYGVQVDVRVVPLDSFGAAAQYFTGSQQHNVRLREIAVKAGLKLNEYGLFKGDKCIGAADEKEIYKALGLDYIEPVLREDRGEIEAARKHMLPELVKYEDIKGDMHMHSVHSDGRSDIEDLASVARDLGYEYICITDHSKSSAIANGLSEKRLRRQIEEIRNLDAEFKGIAILAGSEVDILADGSLDFDADLLKELDFVIASIHSGLTGPSEKVTARALKAMDNPYVNCIAHPTGRLIGQREPMDLDIAKVIEHAAQTGTALEINANPWRLDLKDTHIRMATGAGVKLCIGTDAHSVDGFAAMGFGLTTAGRGWAAKDDILNTRSVEGIRDWVRAKRS